MSITKLLTAIKGGSGSGNFGHSGRPGKIGGSSGGGSVGAPSTLLDGVIGQLGTLSDKTTFRGREIEISKKNRPSLEQSIDRVFELAGYDKKFDQLTSSTVWTKAEHKATISSDYWLGAGHGVVKLILSS